MSDVAPMSRPDKPARKPTQGDPVEVQRVEGGTAMGIIKSLNTTHGQRTVVVQTEERELVTAGRRVKLLTGQLGKQVRRQVEVDDSD